MKTINKIFLILALLLLSGNVFSQQIKVLGKDTVVVLTLPELKKVNKLIVERDYFEKDNILKDSIISLKDSIIKDKDLIILENTSSLDKYKEIVSIRDNEVKDYKKELGVVNKKYKRSQRLWKSGTIIGSALAVVAIVLLGVK